MKKLLSKIIKNPNVLSLAGNATAAAFGFLSFAILARSLDKKDFGNWVIFITICTFFEMIRTGFIQTALVKFVSGKEREEQNAVFGSSWLFATGITLLLLFIGVFAYFIFGHFIASPGFHGLIKWMPVLLILSLPYNFSTWVLQAELKFDKILIMRLTLISTFVIALLLNAYYHNGLSFIVYAYILSHLISSVIGISAGWTKIFTIRYASMAKMKELFHFGKYSMGTMIGSNILRSSDTLLIGAFLGGPAVAIYSIPQKLFEIIEIPLRSFISTALPTISRLINSNDHDGLRNFFERTSGIITLMLLPIILVCLIFAEQMVVLFGGGEYIESANILRIFALYAIFMPLDRYTGVTLDIMNKPMLNFFKVMLMLLVNVSGDILVLKLYGEVWPIAAVSICTFLTGVILGLYFLRKIMSFSFSNILVKSVNKIKGSALDIISRIKVTMN